MSYRFGVINFVTDTLLSNKRLERFLVQIRNICRSSGTFRKKIDVQVGHIAWRAMETGSEIRNAINHEKIASILLNGCVNKERCLISKRIELVVEGRFSEITYIASRPAREVKEKNAGFRVVVREGSAKHVVVTLYHLKNSETDTSTLPEVPNEIW